ncbi:hypothetical protein AgCh_020919 [Apium graveolens]
MKDRTTGRPRGFGFVVFADPAVAERVVKEKHVIHGRTMQESYLRLWAEQSEQLIKAYTQVYSPIPVGGYGLRMDGRFSPTAIGRSRYYSQSPGYGLGSNFKSGLGLNFKGTGHFGPNISYARNMNAFQTGSPNRTDVKMKELMSGVTYHIDFGMI